MPRKAVDLVEKLKIVSGDLCEKAEANIFQVYPFPERRKSCADADIVQKISRRPRRYVTYHVALLEDAVEKLFVHQTIESCRSDGCFAII